VEQILYPFFEWLTDEQQYAFFQGTATAHTTRASMGTLKEVFGDN
jgi:hypothetical protein